LTRGCGRVSFPPRTCSFNHLGLCGRSGSKRSAGSCSPCDLGPKALPRWLPCLSPLANWWGPLSHRPRGTKPIPSHEAAWPGHGQPWSAPPSPHARHRPGLAHEPTDQWRSRSYRRGHRPDSPRRRLPGPPPCPWCPEPVEEKRSEAVIVFVLAK
jgi:hypothetical protein